MAKLAIGMDVGGTFIKAGLVNPEGTILERKKRETRASQGVEAVVRTIQEVCQGLAYSQPLSCIGIGAPGLVDMTRGIVRRPPNLPGWEEVPLRDLLQDRLQARVLVANDADMVTYGEWKFGAGRGVQDLLLITVGTGVGGGIVAGGRLQMGGHGLAGEIGHTIIDPDGPPCNCGNYGCLESFVGAEYLKKRTISLINKGLKTSIPELVKGNLELITPEVISRAAKMGDTLARRTMQRLGECLGIALSNAISLLDPERVVVGGGVSNAGELLFNPIRDTIQERLFSYPLTKIEVVPAKLGENGGVIGAAMYAMSKIF